jgi:hypothetical protein
MTPLSNGLSKAGPLSTVSFRPSTRLTNLAMVRPQLLNRARPRSISTQVILRQPTSSVVLTESFQDAMAAPCMALLRNHSMMIIS